ncbi:MAG: PEP-CTERM sorting domain-containing protein [Planctomycetota bacterium]
MPHPRTFLRCANALTALVAVLACATSHAAIVQITQTDNRATTLVDNINPDLTGDGIADVTATVTANYLLGGGSIQFEVQMTIEGENYTAAGGDTFTNNGVVAPSEAPVIVPLGTSAELSVYFPIVFSDAAYGLTGEDGWVEVFLRADDTAAAESGIEFRRLVFDPDARGTPGFDQNVSYPEAVVPEPSTLALSLLLTLGLSRRRTYAVDRAEV